MRSVVAVRARSRFPAKHYVVLTGAGVAGTARVTDVPSGMWVSDLHVEPEHRRQGVGRLLMKQILQAETRPLVLSVGAYGKEPGPTDEQLREFYEGLGFRAAGGAYMRREVATGSSSVERVPHERAQT